MKLLTTVDETKLGPVQYHGNRLMVQIERVAPDPDQPRTVFDKEKLAELVESVRVFGILQDLMVRPSDKGDGYVILDGERRWRAAKLVGLKVVPVSVRVVTGPSMISALQLTANLQRENLNALEEAAAFGKRVEAGTKPEDLAKELGISRATVFGRLALRKLSEPVRQVLLKGEISTSVAALVSLVPGPVQQKMLLEEVKGDEFDGPMSVRRVKEEVEERYQRPLKDAGWPLDQVFSKEFGNKINWQGTCASCPKRTGNMVGTFPELAARPNVCTDVGCFDLKTQEWARMQLAEAKKSGKPVLEAGQAFHKYGGVKDGLVDLADRCAPLGWEAKKNWKEALGKLGKDAPQVIVAVDKQGKLHELVKKDEAVKALKESGRLKKGERVDDSNERWRKQQARDRKLAAAKAKKDAAIAAALVAKAEQLKLADPEWLWRAIISGLSSLAGYYVEDPIIRRRGWKKGFQAMEKQLKGMTLSQAVGLAVEIVARNDDDKAKLAKGLGVDLKKVIAEQKATKGTKGTKGKAKK